MLKKCFHWRGNRNLNGNAGLLVCFPLHGERVIGEKCNHVMSRRRSQWHYAGTSALSWTGLFWRGWNVMRIFDVWQYSGGTVLRSALIIYTAPVNPSVSTVLDDRTSDHEGCVCVCMGCGEWGGVPQDGNRQPSLRLHINGVISEHSVHGESANRMGQAPLKAARWLASISLYPGALFLYYYRELPEKQINKQLPVGLTYESLRPLGTTPFQGIRPATWGYPSGCNGVVSLTVPVTEECGCCCCRLMRLANDWSSRPKAKSCLFLFICIEPR